VLHPAVHAAVMLSLTTATANRQQGKDVATILERNGVITFPDPFLQGARRAGCFGRLACVVVRFDSLLHRA
jgi:hypothetical protein